MKPRPSENTISASARSLVAISKARSKSADRRPSRDCSFSPNSSAAVWLSRQSRTLIGFAAFQRALCALMFQHPARTASTPDCTCRHVRCRCASPFCGTDGACRRRRSSPSRTVLSTAPRVSRVGTSWASPLAACAAWLVSSEGDTSRTCAPMARGCARNSPGTTTCWVVGNRRTRHDGPCRCQQGAYCPCPMLGPRSPRAASAGPPPASPPGGR